MFRDRAEAGRLLARRLQAYNGKRNLLVVGLARGGIPVARAVADALGAPLDVFLVRKLGVPGEPELGFGAIAEGPVRVINQTLVRERHLTPETVEEIATREQRQMEVRRRKYRASSPVLTVRGQVVIVVDDGLATGLTMVAAVRALRRRGASRIVVAVPVGSRQACEALRAEADEVVCLSTPQPFHAVGAWYEEFFQVTDDEVQEALSSTVRIKDLS